LALASFTFATGACQTAVLLSTYAHLIEEYAERERVDPELEIAKVREMNVRLECVSATEERSAGLTAHEKSPASAGPFWDGSDGGLSRTLPPDHGDIEVWAEPPQAAGQSRGSDSIPSGQSSSE
jgi:hypothetical protein